ncbi:MAG: hypothetical protein MUC63_04325 [Planctomycetes bacterium]|jgi:hypothetical protein|nr:hypothetical protein [Planctomycetota bacterium]
MDTAVLERAEAGIARPAAFTRCMDEAQAILRDAADSWAAGDAETPSTLEMLVGVLQVFAQGGFLSFPVLPTKHRRS